MSLTKRNYEKWELQNSFNNEVDEYDYYYKNNYFNAYGNKTNEGIVSYTFGDKSPSDKKKGGKNG